MTFTKEQADRVLELSRPLIHWINQNGHPHITIVIDDSSATIQESKACVITKDFIKD